MALFNFGKGNENAMGANIPVSQFLSMKAQGMNNSQIANQLRAAGFSLTQIRDAMAQAEIKSAVMPGGSDMGFNPNVQTGGPLPEMMPEENMMNGMPQMPDMQNQGIEQMEMPPLPDVPAAPMGMEMQPQQNYPMQQQYPVQQQRGAAPEQIINELQRVIEEIIEEKWSGVEDKLNALEVWKAKLEGNISESNNRIAALNQRLDSISKGIFDKTESYQGTMEDVNTQMEAVEKLMGKLVPSLAEEIKELRDVVEKLKKH
jgi:hypothetical protein